METWPASLPQTPDETFEVRPASGLLSDEDTLSPQRNRTYPDSEATFRIKQLTIAQVQLLRTFYSVTLNQAKPFTVPWLAGVGFTNHFCRFMEPPTLRAKGINFDVSLRLLIVSGVPMAGDQIVYGGTS